MIILFILGALQGALGWIMVQSGLTEKYYVGHVSCQLILWQHSGCLLYTLVRLSC